MSAAEAATDPALETLLLPIDDGRVRWPETGVLFLRARAGAALLRHPRPGLICEQSFRPDAEALQRAGYTVRNHDGVRYALVLVLPPRQRDEARALMARALAATAPGGRIVACVSNVEGARSSEDDFARLLGAIETQSKHKCRVFWSAALQGPADAALAAQWAELDRARPIGDGRFVSRPGVFAWDRIDPASALLAENLPADLHGRAADLGAGFGYLSAQLLQRCPQITALDVYEAEERALALARRNLAGFAASVAISFHWHDVTAGLPKAYDVIVTNPPFHSQQRAERPDIGRQFIAVAAQALRPGGCLWLVANRHLPYEAVLDSSFGRVRTVTQQDGFKIIEAVKLVARTPLRRPRP